MQNYYILNKILNVFFFYKNVEKVIKIKCRKEERKETIIFLRIYIDFFSQNIRKCHIVPFVVTHMNIMFLPFYPKNPMNV